MHRSFYPCASFFLALTVAAGLLQSVIRLRLGDQLFFLEPFPAWLLVTTLVSQAGALLVIKYYHYRQYRFAFWAGGIATLSSFCHSAVIYRVLVARAGESYLVPAILLALGTSIVYAVSLIFSRTGKSPLLRAAGVYMFIQGLVITGVLAWGSGAADARTNDVLKKADHWASLAGSLMPLLFIAHFRRERKTEHAEDADASLPGYFTNGWVAARVVAFACTATTGVMLANAGYWSVYWGKRNFEKTQQLARRFEARAFVGSTGDTLRYRLLKPLGYDFQKKYPLVVCLPYGGQPGTDPIRQVEGAAAAQVLSEEVNRKKYPAFLFVPHCPPGSGWGGIPNHPSVDALVYEALTALEKEPGIDVKRRYVTGISRGGYGSWHFICTRPEMFAAAIPVCGGGDPALARGIVDVAVWAFHGEKDRNVPVRGSREMIGAIKKAGGNPRYTEFKGAGHNIWHQVAQTPGVWDWLFAQQRD